MRFGANYTPRRGWFHHWLDFDPAEQRSSYRRIVKAPARAARVAAYDRT